MANQETIHRYASDMLSVNKHILEAVEKQKDSDSVKKSPKAQQVVNKVFRIQQEHVNQLENHISTLEAGNDNGNGIAKAAKDAVTATAGAAAGVFDLFRDDTASKMLRDDYTALSMAAVSYTMLNATGIALGSQSTADLALTHLKNITPAITEISKVVADTVVDELQEKENTNTVMASAAELSTRRTQEAWTPEHTATFTY